MDPLPVPVELPCRPSALGKLNRTVNAVEKVAKNNSVKIAILPGVFEVIIFSKLTELLMTCSSPSTYQMVSVELTGHEILEQMILDAGYMLGADLVLIVSNSI